MEKQEIPPHIPWHPKGSGVRQWRGNGKDNVTLHTAPLYASPYARRSNMHCTLRSVGPSCVAIPHTRFSIDSICALNEKAVGEQQTSPSYHSKVCGGVCATDHGTLGAWTVRGTTIASGIRLETVLSLLFVLIGCSKRHSGIGRGGRCAGGDIGCA